VDFVWAIRGLFHLYCHGVYFSSDDMDVVVGVRDMMVTDVLVRLEYGDFVL